MNKQPITVALAILYQQGQFLLQLRDDFPHIFYPGQWGLFGGHLESSETPEEALRRELWEEITYEATVLTFWRCYTEGEITRYLYHGPLVASLEELEQHEGQDLALASPEAIASGLCYSPKLKQSRGLGKTHRQILLDFLATQS